MDKKNALDIAADQLAGEQDGLVELGKWIGRQQAFGLVANKCSAAQAECLKRIKASGEYKTLGLSWEQFCDQHLGIHRVTAERIIANYDEFGAAYFTLSNIMRISPQTYRLLAPAVTDENEILFGDEKIPITKQNAEKVIEAVNAIRKEAEQTKQQLYDTKSDLKKARDERDNAKKAAENARKELQDFKQRDEQLFPDADADQKQMLKIQSSLDFAFVQLANLGKRDLSPDNQGRLIGLVEYAFRHLVQVSCAIRDEFGEGLISVF